MRTLAKVPGISCPTCFSSFLILIMSNPDPYLIQYRRYIWFKSDISVNNKSGIKGIWSIYVQIEPFMSKMVDSQACPHMAILSENLHIASSIHHFHFRIVVGSSSRVIRFPTLMQKQISHHLNVELPGKLTVVFLIRFFFRLVLSNGYKIIIFWRTPERQKIIFLKFWRTPELKIPKDHSIFVQIFRGKFCCFS